MGKGSKLNVENYRPIGLIDLFFKLTESLIRKKILEFFDVNELTSLSQSGFKPGWFKLSQLFMANNALVDCFNVRVCIDGVYKDLSKAFDSISHKIYN